MPGSDLTVPQVGLNPTRMGFVEVLRRMGASLESAEWGAPAGEPVGSLRARHSRLKATTVEAAALPALIDEVPLLAVVASQAYSLTRLCGLSELRHKESDRLAGTAAALSAMGAKARVEGDDLLVEGPCALRGAAVKTLGDHRLTMAFTVAALMAEGETTLSDAGSVAISFPGFFPTLAGLLA